MAELKKVRQVLIYTLILNIIVAFAKIVYGYTIDSISMLSDGYHSFFDGTSNIIGLIGVWIASQPPDKDHPYGHRKFETLSTIAIAVLIFGAGIEILREAYHRIEMPGNINVTAASFVIMGVTLAVNFWVMFYETKKGKELKSEFLLADAIHTKTDIFISLSVVVSLIAAKAGYPVIDTMAAIAIALFIGKMGISILKSASAVLTDAACIDAEEIRRIAKKIEGVMDCHGIRTRGKEGHASIDMHVLVDPDVKIGNAHDIAHHVEEALKKHFSDVEDVVIHVEPYYS
ncbi:MAG: cation transporter [Nitrospiraceae bacterium]|nr:MAG: cation transporter [Nitrospiraceae bacterium]